MTDRKRADRGAFMDGRVELRPPNTLRGFSEATTSKDLEGTMVTNQHLSSAECALLCVVAGEK